MRKSPLERLAYAAIVPMLVCLVGCSVMKSANNYWTGSKPPRVPELPADSSCLVIVDCDIGGFTLRGGTIDDAGGDVHGGQVYYYDVVAFFDLPPGPYALSQIWGSRTEYDNGVFVVPADFAQRDFEAVAGKPLYIGRIKIGGSRRKTKWSLEYSVEREVKMWDEVLSHLEETDWVQPIRMRIEELTPDP